MLGKHAYSSHRHFNLQDIMQKTEDSINGHCMNPLIHVFRNKINSKTISQSLDHLPAEVCLASGGMDSPKAFHCCSRTNPKKQKGMKNQYLHVRLLRKQIN